MEFKFLGKIGEKEIVVMMDTIANHNFISKKLVAELQIPVEKTGNYSINHGAGHYHKGAEVCTNVAIKTHGVEIVQTFFPTDLAVADVVLGSEFLTSTGGFKMHAAGSTTAITLDWLGRSVTFHSDPSLTNGMKSGLILLTWDDEA